MFLLIDLYTMPTKTACFFPSSSSVDFVGVDQFIREMEKKTLKDSIFIAAVVKNAPRDNLTSNSEGKERDEEGKQNAPADDDDKLIGFWWIVFFFCVVATGWKKRTIPEDADEWNNKFCNKYIGALTSDDGLVYD